MYSTPSLELLQLRADVLVGLPGGVLIQYNKNTNNNNNNVLIITLIITTSHNIVIIS